MHDAKHQASTTEIQKRVLFVGTANTTFRKGIGLCYNRDYATTALPAGSINGERDNRVEVPSTSNNRNFAGVLADNVTLPSTGEAWVTINEPGSTCLVALGANTVINTPYLTCLAGGGNNTSRFTDKGFLGRGSVLPLQTVTALLEDGKAGTGSILHTDGKTMTVSDSSDFTVGVDKVLILASEDEGTAKKLVVGVYDIASITSPTVIVLSTDARSTGTASAALSCSYIVIDGDNDLALAYLDTGLESGLVTWVTAPNAGDTDYAPMMGGVSYIGGGLDIAADFDIDLPDGTIYGERIGFILKGTLATSDMTVDLNTNGYRLNGAALAEFNTMDDAGDACFLKWNGVWRTSGKVGTGTAEA